MKEFRAGRERSARFFDGDRVGDTHGDTVSPLALSVFCSHSVARCLMLERTRDQTSPDLREFFHIFLNSSPIGKEILDGKGKAKASSALPCGNKRLNGRLGIAALVLAHVTGSRERIGCSLDIALRHQPSTERQSERQTTFLAVQSRPNEASAAHAILLCERRIIRRLASIYCL